MDILILDATTKSIVATLSESSSASPINYTVSYGDVTSTGMIEGVQSSVSNDTGNVTICNAPSASTRRIIRNISVYNKDTISHNIKVSILSGGIYYGVMKKTLASGASWSFGQQNLQDNESISRISFYQDSSLSTGGLYGTLSGLINGVNTNFVVSQGSYISGTLLVYKNGQQLIPSADWTQTTPNSGTFALLIAPASPDVITVSYQKVLSSFNAFDADLLDGQHGSYYMKNVAPSTSGNVLMSNGSAWVSNPPANRNAIINGGMDIWQRGTATLTNPASNTYFPDRFKHINLLGDGTYNLLQNPESPTANFPFQYSLQFDVTHIETAVAAGEFSALMYVMEGNDFKRFEGNTATLSFWVKATKTGIYCISFRNSLSDKSYICEYTISSSNTWEKKAITLAFNGGGTWEYGINTGVKILWTIMCGSTYHSPTANTWGSGNYFATANQVNGMDNVANNFYLTGVQMELGSVATPFEFRPYQQELALCQRYYERISGFQAVGTSVMAGFADSTSGALFSIRFAPKRTPPTLGYDSLSSWSIRYANSGVSVCTALTFGGGDSVGSVNATATGTPLTAGQGCNLRATATTAVIDFSAEL